MKSLTLWMLICTFLTLAGGACRRAEHDEGGHEQHGHDEHDAGAHDDDPDGAHESEHLDIAGIRGVEFVTVEPPRQEGAWFAAEAISDSSAVATLSTPVAGIVTALLAAPGQAVGRGAGVVEIRSPELAELKARWSTAVARRERARRDRERELRLDAVAATSKRDLEAAESELTIAEAEEEAARLALEARGVAPASASPTLVVRAPRGGAVSSFAVTLGQGVTAGQTLGELVAAGAGLVSLELPLPGPETWALGEATEVRHADGRRWPATVVGVPSALSTDTRRLAYRLRLDTTRQAPPLAGTPLEVRVPLARSIVLPQTALQQIEGTWGVFVRQGAEAEFRPVRKGAELGGDVLVLEGVAPGEEVAVAGAYLLKSLFLKHSGGGDGHDH